MKDEKSSQFFYQKNFLGLFAWVWVRAHFPSESPFIDLTYKLSFSSFAEVSKLWIQNFIQYYLKKDFHHKFTNLSFLNRFTVFVDAPLKSNSPYFLLNKNINFSKTESKMENLTQAFKDVMNIALQLIKNHKLKLKLR